MTGDAPRSEGRSGPGFSEALSTCLESLLEMVRAELAGMADEVGRHCDFDARDVLASGSPSAEAGGAPAAVEPSEALHDLLGYAHDHAQARLHTHRSPNLVDRLSSDVPGVALAGRLRPWGVFVESGDWFDAVPLDGGALGIVVGNVDGRGVEAAAAMSDLRAAVRAYVVLDGDSPSRLLRHLDRLAASTGLGHKARLLYLTLQPATGEVRYANAGGCPPLLLDDRTPHGRFVDSAGGPSLGAVAEGDRGEGTLRLSANSTLLLFTDGLVESRAVSRAAGMDRLRIAAREGPAGLDDLCEHALTVCTGGLRRDDDICLLGVRLVADAVRAQAEPSQRCHR